MAEGGGGAQLSRLLALHSIFHRQLIVFFSHFFVSFAFLFHFGFAFVLFCFVLLLLQAKSTQIENDYQYVWPVRLAGQRQSGWPQGRGGVLEGETMFSACKVACVRFV